MKLKVPAGNATASISTALEDTSDCAYLLVFAHGAGAGMHHEFMHTTAAALLAAGVATLRFNFPYMERGRRAPDRQPTLIASLTTVVAYAQTLAAGRPVYAGGKSMGGRMASIAAAEGLLPTVRGLVFFGFPLHAAGKPSTQRAAHLDKVKQPMLFLQGTRDRLADPTLIEPVCHDHADRATLTFFTGADHSFHYLKSAAAQAERVHADIAATVRRWVATH